MLYYILPPRRFFRLFGWVIPESRLLKFVTPLWPLHSPFFHWWKNHNRNIVMKTYTTWLYEDPQLKAEWLDFFCQLLWSFLRKVFVTNRRLHNKPILIKFRFLQDLQNESKNWNKIAVRGRLSATPAEKLEMTWRNLFELVENLWRPLLLKKLRCLESHLSII